MDDILITEKKIEVHLTKTRRWEWEWPQDCFQHPRGRGQEVLKVILRCFVSSRLACVENENEHEESRRFFFVKICFVEVSCFFFFFLKLKKKMKVSGAKFLTK